MNVTGAANSVIPNRPLAGQAASRPAEQRTNATAGLPAQPAPASQPARKPAESGTQELSARAPEGTDPALWSILTHEERSYFSRIALDGPLTYSKVMTRGRTEGVTGASAARGGAPIARGGRIDIRA